MQEIRDFLKSEGSTKEEIDACIQAITNIHGDHLQFYKHINALCKSQDDLHHTRSLIAQLDMGGEQKVKKRSYVRKQPTGQSLVEKSGVAVAHEALKEQAPMPGEPVHFPAPEKPKRQPRKRESEAEIKANVDSLTGGVKLTPEEAALNLSIDL